MKTIAISDILITNRQRRHFGEDALTQLSTSIRKKSLLHPIVLRDDSRTLVAGERRTRAVASLGELGVSITCDGQIVPENHIPYVVLGELSSDDLVEAELEENILREDLTWSERADAIATLHALRCKQDPTTTFKATAEELIGNTPTSAAQKEVRKAVIIQEHLSDPAVAKAKSAKEALKIIEKKKQQELTNQLAEQFDISTTPHSFNCGDFRDFTHLIETGSVDVILTDPPYGIGANNFGDQADASHEYEDSPEYFKEIISAFILEASRVTKERAHLYTFCDPRFVPLINGQLEAAGWNVWSVPLIWDKGNGMLPDPDAGPRRTYETCIFANKGRKFCTAVFPDVIRVPGLPNPRYGAEKPVELYDNLLRRSTKPGDLVWDPFAGSGPIFPAGNKCSVRVVGTEMNPEKYAYAKLRLGEEE